MQLLHKTAAIDRTLYSTTKLCCPSISDTLHRNRSTFARLHKPLRRSLKHVVCSKASSVHPVADVRPLASLDRSIQQRACQVVAAASPLPHVVVFDLDYCLWPYWCETKCIDDEPELFPEVIPVLQALRDSGVMLAVASRTPTPQVATHHLNKLGLTSLFHIIQLVPAGDGVDQMTAQKDTCHFPNIQKATGVAYKRMLFFDDEHRNVAKVARLGVCSVCVNPRNGITVGLLSEALQQYARHDRALRYSASQQSIDTNDNSGGLHLKGGIAVNGVTT